MTRRAFGLDADRAATWGQLGDGRTIQISRHQRARPTCAIAKRGYEGAASTDPKLRAEAVSIFISVRNAACLRMTDGRHAVTIPLLGSFVAASFATTAGADGGALVSGTPLIEQQPLITRSPHG